MVALYSFFVTLLLIFREVSSLPSIQNDISLEELGPIEVSQVPGDGQVIETVVEEMPAENGIESPIPGLSPGEYEDIIEEIQVYDDYGDDGEERDKPGGPFGGPHGPDIPPEIENQLHSPGDFGRGLGGEPNAKPIFWRNTADFPKLNDVSRCGPNLGRTTTTTRPPEPPIVVPPTPLPVVVRRKRRQVPSGTLEEANEDATSGNSEQNVFVDYDAETGQVIRSGNAVPGMVPGELEDFIEDTAVLNNDDGDLMDEEDKPGGPMGGPVGPDIPPEIDGRQMGGDVAFSFMVSITDEMDQFLCSGVLTYDTWVISAASCFVGCKDEAIFTFRVGSNQWNIGGKEYKVQKNAQPKKIHLHPNYRIGGTPDLALIGLNEATMLDPVCVMGQPIPAVSASGEKFAAFIDLGSPRTRVTVLGWGSAGLGGLAMPMRKDVSIMQEEYPIFASYQCSRMATDYRTRFCYGPQNMRQPCIGDKGSPVMALQGGRWWLVGIHSGHLTKSPECSPRWPLLATRVDRFIEWMEQVISVSTEKADVQPNPTDPTDAPKSRFWDWWG